MLRYEPKDFRPQRWNPDTRRWTFGGFPPTLYRLPQVKAAIGAGEPVYLVEGEKDADTANRYGVVGTTNASGGGRGKFLAEHAEQLRGAHVVVVADRDKAGYEHALEASERLQGVAASTRVVRAATGKDLTDHADGGLDIDGLEAIDPAAELAALTGEPSPQTEESGRSAGGPPPPTGGGGGSRSDDDGVPNQLPRYLHRHGETVRVNGSADKPTFATVWRCEVSVTAEIVNDNGDPNADPLSGGWQLKLRRRRLDLAGAPVRDDAGELVHDEAHIVLPAEKIRDGSWPELLPWAGLIHDFTPAGKSRALSAATLVQPFPAEMLRRYTSTGWRTLPDGRDMFVHAGGGITAAGPIPLDEVAVTGKLRVFDMPAPTQDPVDLKMAVLEGFLPLLDLPAAVVAPLIGFAFRGIFGSPRASIHLVGDPGSGKTGITRAAAMHWFAPAMREHGRGARKEVFSGADEVGDSLKGLLGKLYEAADIPVLVDDFKGSKATARLGHLQSAIWNGGDRTLGTRTGGSLTTGEPRAAIITTGETSTTGSSATRALTIRVGTRTITDDPETLFGALEKRACRQARGLIGASFIQWLAGRRTELTEWIDLLEEEGPYVEAWSKVCASLDQEPGIRGRLSRVAIVCTTGWVALLSWLRQSGTLTEDEADFFWEWAIGGIVAQIHEQDPSSTDGPLHMLDLLRSALLSGVCHLSDQRGGVPEEVRHATSMDSGVPYGWAPRTSVTGPLAEGTFGRDEVIWQARGDRVGIITDDEVWLMPRAVLGVVSSVAGKAGETFPHTSVSLGAAMAGRGWISANGSGDRSANRRISSVQQRVWVMLRAVLDGDDDDTNDDKDPSGGPVTPFPVPWRLPDSPVGTPVPHADPATPTRTVPDPEPAEPAEHSAAADPVVHVDPPEQAEVAESADPELPLFKAAADVEPAAPAPAPAAPHRAAAPAAPSRRPDERWLAAGAVITGDELVLPDGTRVHLGPELTHLGQLAELAAELRLGHGGGKYVLPSPAQLLLTTEGMTRFGITVDSDVDVTDPDAASDAARRGGKAAAAAAVAAGWNLSQDNQLRVWTRVWRPKTEARPSVSVQIVLVPLMGAFDDSKALTADDPTADVLARRIQLVADALGVTWMAGGGSTGLTLLRQLRSPRATSGRAPLAATEYVAPPPPMLRDPGRVPNTAILWCRRADGAEGQRGWIHAYDANAMYLAAQGATEVGVGAPEYHRDGTPFNPKIAGLWRIKPGDADDWRLPDITRPAGQLPGTTAWYPTPVIRYLTEELGQQPEILEAYTWAGTTRRYFDQWYQVVRDARTAMMTAAAAGDTDAAVVLRAVKEVYKRTVGRLARVDDGKAKSPLYRPDWRLAIVSTANVNLLRKLRRAGEQTDSWPVAISTDEVFYLSDEPDPTVALPAPLRLGDGLGQFKISRSAPMSDEIGRALAAGRLAGLLPLVPKLGDQ